MRLRVMTIISNDDPEDTHRARVELFDDGDDVIMFTGDPETKEAAVERAQRAGAMFQRFLVEMQYLKED